MPKGVGSADPNPAPAIPTPAAIAAVVYWPTVAEAAETIIPAAPTPMATTGRCKVWGERCGTDDNGTDKKNESFSQHSCLSLSEHRPHGLKIAPATYGGLNGFNQVRVRFNVALSSSRSSAPSPRARS